MFRITILLLMIVCSSCAWLQMGNENFFYYNALDTFEESVPPKILRDCKFSKDLKVPVIHPHKILPPENRAYYDPKDQSIHYSIDYPEDIIHETYHYISDEANFSTHCHEQMAASFLKSSVMKDLIYRRRK